MTKLDERADRAWQLADEGWTVPEIARELRTSRESIYVWLSRDEVPLSRAWLFRDADDNRPACSFCLGEGPASGHERSCPARGRARRLSPTPGG